MTELARNPRYAAYCRAHGRGPDAQLAQDKIDWPGGQMAGFILWNNERLGEARKAIPTAFMFGGQLIDHPAYNAWLDVRVEHLRKGLWRTRCDNGRWFVVQPDDTVSSAGPWDTEAKALEALGYLAWVANGGSAD